MAAAARVFAVGELVEMILLELPMKDLLLSQRINRTCKGAVDSSVRIRKALFLVPGDADDINGANITSDRDSLPGGKLSAKLAKDFRFGRDSAKAEESGVAFNPLLVSRVHLDAWWPWITVYIRLQTFDLPECASCFKMLTTQPPVEFRMCTLHVLGRIDADADTEAYQIYTSLPWSIEGTTVRNFTKKFQEIRNEEENEAMRGYMQLLSLSECELTMN